MKFSTASACSSVARQVIGKDFEDFDYVIGMDNSNVENMRKLAGYDEAKILKFMDLLPDEKLREVPDPYFTGNFEEVYQLINACVRTEIGLNPLRKCMIGAFPIRNIKRGTAHQGAACLASVGIAQRTLVGRADQLSGC